MIACLIFESIAEEEERRRRRRGRKGEERGRREVFVILAMLITNGWTNSPEP